MLQKLREAQDINEAVLDAEVRIGELMAKVPKEPGRRNDIQPMDNAVDILPTKADVIRDAGFTPKQVERFQTLAVHPEIVAQAKAEARENDGIVSRSLVLLTAGKQRGGQTARTKADRTERPER